METVAASIPEKKLADFQKSTTLAGNQKQVY